MKWLIKKLSDREFKVAVIISVTLLFYIAGQLVNWATVEEKFVNMQINDKLNIYIPKGMTAKVDVSATHDYKEELLERSGRDLKNIWLLLLNSIGINKAPVGPIPPSKVQKINLDNLQEVPEVPLEKQQKTGTLSLIVTNLSDAFSSFNQFLTVRIVIVDNQQYVVKEDGKLSGGPQEVMKWAPAIEKSAQKYNLEPALIAAVMEQESGGDPSSVSPSGAIGLMQLMPSTARFLKINPYNPEDNIDGGAKYLAMMMDQFGNQELALAAYNAGPGNVYNNKYIYIPETMGYISKVPRLMAKYQKLKI